jgi:GNAT superfamily N-acetyltransferase
MSAEELRGDIEQAGIEFWVAELDGGIAAVMGTQQRDLADRALGPDVTLIRHAYTRPEHQGKGVGSALLATLRDRTERPVLIGTWAAGDWAINFYLGRGFELVADGGTKDRLLRTYWFVEGLGALNSPVSDHRQKQMAASVVLADARWRDASHSSASESASPAAGGSAGD